MLTTGEPILLNLPCAVHRRIQAFPGRWRLGSWIEGRRGNLMQVRSGPKAMGHGIELFISMQDIYDGQKYFVHGFNAREPLGNLLCQVMRRGDSALDIGANVDYFTGMLSLLAGKEGQVFSFEATPLIHERLQTVARRNPHGNVRPRHFAVSDHCGQVELNLGPPDDTGISSMRDLPESGGKVSVPAMTIDSARRVADHQACEDRCRRGRDAGARRDGGPDRTRSPESFHPGHRLVSAQPRIR